MASFLTKIFTPPSSDDPLDARLGWTLHRILLLTLGVVVLGGIVSTIFLAPRVFIGSAYAVIIASVVGLLVILRSGRLRLAANLLVWGLWSVVAAVTILLTGVTADVATAMTVPVVIAGLVQGRREALAVAATSVVFGGALAVAEHYGIGPIALVPETELSALVTQSVIALEIAALLQIALSAVERSLHTSSLAQERLTGAVEALDQTSLSKAQLDDILGAVGDAVFVTDSHDAIVTSNATARRLLGFDPTGQKLEALLVSHTLVDDTGIRGASRDEGRLIPKEGQPIPVLYAFSFIEVEDLRFLVYVATDIRMLREAEAEAVAAANAARDANQLKNVFLAGISHETRTPLASILGYTELLLEDIEDEGLVKDLKQIQASSEHLLGLIDDILDLSTIESGDLIVSKRPTLVAPLITHLSHSVAPLFEKSASTLRLEGQVEDLTLDIDPKRFLQITMNLLSNAAKFTREGEVTLHIDVVPDADQVHFAVKDNGIGMSPEEVSRLFEPFAQAHEHITHDYGGTGLGLYISAQYAQAMGGDIRVESDLGVGSTFTLTLPTTKEQRCPG